MFYFALYSFYFEDPFSRVFNTFLFANNSGRSLVYRCVKKFQYEDSILRTIDSVWVSGEIRNGHRMLRLSFISVLLLFQVEKNFRFRFKFTIAKCLGQMYFLHFWNSVHSTKGDTAIMVT